MSSVPTGCRVSATTFEGLIADGIKNNLTINSAGSENSWLAWGWNTGVNFGAGFVYDAVNLSTFGAFGAADRNLQKAMRGEQITVGDMLTTNWYGGNQDGWNPGTLLKGEAIGLDTAAFKTVVGIATLAYQTSMPMLVYGAYKNFVDPVGEAEKRKQAVNSALAGIKQWWADLSGAVMHPEEIVKAADAVGPEKTGEILSEAEFDAAMIADTGLGMVKLGKAGVKWAKNAARVERTVADVSSLTRVESQIAKHGDDIAELQGISGEADTSGMMRGLRESDVVGMADEASQGGKVYGVHWTSTKAEAKIFEQGRINASYNDLMWFEKAESPSQLKSILQKNGVETGAKSNEVAIIADLTGLEPRIVGGGGVAYRLPEGMQLTGEGGRGLTWYRNTGLKQHINKIIDFVREGKNSYGRK